MDETTKQDEPNWQARDAAEVFAALRFGPNRIIAAARKRSALPDFLAQLGRWLTVAILLLASATFAFGTLIRDDSTADMFIAAVDLTVAIEDSRTSLYTARQGGSRA